VAAGLAAVGVGAAVTVLDDDPPPTVEPAPAAAVSVVTPATPTRQLTVAEEVALLHGTATTVPTTFDICLNQTPC
jgi:hypothetical protein